jgi:hypothetical protein
MAMLGMRRALDNGRFRRSNKAIMSFRAGTAVRDKFGKGPLEILILC